MLGILEIPIYHCTILVQKHSVLVHAALDKHILSKSKQIMHIKPVYAARIAAYGNPHDLNFQSDS